jgi:hypothetical protein
MKKLLIWMLLNVAFISIKAQTVAWAKKGGLWAYDYGYGIANDNSGNVYVAGKYELNANFSGVILPNHGNHDIYVAKYDPAGNLSWIRTAGGYTGDYAWALACDGLYVYVTGEIEGSGAVITFDGSPITLTAQGANDVFIAKYTTSGTLLWARRAGGYDDEKPRGITYDNFGNVFVCGYFQSYISFPGTTLYGSGNLDIFIAKYDAFGNFLWAKKAGSAGRDEAKGIKCDASGNVYITGMHNNGCNFGSVWLASPGGNSNMFLAKYSPSGNLLWAKTGGSSYEDLGWSVTIDALGKIYVSGEFNANANFGGTTIYTSGGQDIFVACYDSGGNIVWVRKAGGAGDDRAKGIAVAGSAVYITGQFGGAATFGPFTKFAADNADIFVACINSNTGNFNWVTAAGGPPDALEPVGYESGNAICAQTSGNVYATGSTLDGATFGNTSLSAFARTDMFVVKLLSAPSDRSDEELLSTATEADKSDNIVKAELKIYPNPSTGNFSIELNSSDNLKYTLIIFNSLGQIVEQQEVRTPVFTNVDLADREKGFYFIELKNSEAMLRKKIVLE